MTSCLYLSVGLSTGRRVWAPHANDRDVSGWPPRGMLMRAWSVLWNATQTRDECTQTWTRTWWGERCRSRASRPISMWQDSSLAPADSGRLYLRYGFGTSPIFFLIGLWSTAHLYSSPFCMKYVFLHSSHTFDCLKPFHRAGPLAISFTRFL